MSARPRAAPARDASGTGRLAAAALLISASFVVSRVLGLLRNVVIADVFGSSRSVEAYFAAFRIPDTMFMLVSGGALASAVVPLITGLISDGEETEAWRVAATVLNTVAIALAAMALVADLFAPQIMGVLVQGFTPSEQQLTVTLTRIMLLQPIFLGVSALLSALLQSYGRWTLTAVAPLLYNLCVILGAGLFGSTHGVSALAWAVVAGALAQLLVQFPGLWREFRLWFVFTIDWRSAGTREVLRLFVPRLVGLAAFQVMLLITLFLAARLPRGNVAAINYAWPLIMFPVGALGTAVGTVILPTVSGLHATQEYAVMVRTLNRGLRLVLFLAFPASVGLVVLRRPIVNLLFNHGHWTSRATEQTAFALLFYALAIAALSAIEVIPRVFYALKDTVTPVRIAVISVALDAVLSVLFVNVLPPDSGQGGLALATAIASTVQAIWLASALEGRLGQIGRASLLITIRDAAIASLVMGMVLYLVLDPLTAVFPQHGWGVLITVCLQLLLGAGTFVLTAYVLDVSELEEVYGLLRMRFRSGAGRRK